MPDAAPHSSGEDAETTTSSPRCAPTTDLLTSTGELGLGAAILAVRQFNTWRRDLASTVPPVAELVDTSVEAVAGAASLASTELCSAIDASGGLVPEPVQPVVSAVRDVAASVPALLRISGLAAPE